MNRSTPANSTMSSKRSRICERFMPRMPPFKKTLSRPVSSGWKPVPTSSSDPTRPRIRATPAVGSVMRARILSIVVLPAPLRPTIPTTSPSSAVKLTPFRAQNQRASRERRKDTASRTVPPQ
jgi:hypothetical protein